MDIHPESLPSGRGGWWYLDLRYLEPDAFSTFAKPEATLLVRLLKPSWVRVDDTAAQLFPNFQSELIKALQVVILKVIRLSPAKAVLFYFQLLCRCDPFRKPYI